MLWLAVFSFRSFLDSIFIELQDRWLELKQLSDLDRSHEPWDEYFMSGQLKSYLLVKDDLKNGKAFSVNGAICAEEYQN